MKTQERRHELKSGGLILRDHPAHEVHRKFEMINIFILQISAISGCHYYLTVYKPTRG